MFPTVCLFLFLGEHSFYFLLLFYPTLSQYVRLSRSLTTLP